MSSILLVCVLFGVGLCATIPPDETTTFVTTPDARPGCIYNGWHLTPGEHVLYNPCTPLHCSANGHIFQGYKECYVEYCVDPVYTYEHCCKYSCPNGQNCHHTDGTIIKMGEVYQPDTKTTCTCPTAPFRFGGVQKVFATCVSQGTSTTMLPVVG